LAVQKLSQIALAGSNASTSTLFVAAATPVDLLYTGAQVGAGIPITINTTPIIGGTNNSILFNNGGTVGGDSGLTYAGSGGGVTLNSNATLIGDAANVLALRNGANAQTFNLYDSFTDVNNYARTRYSSHQPVIMETLGTGAFATVSSSTPLVSLVQTMNDGGANTTIFGMVNIQMVFQSGSDASYYLSCNDSINQLFRIDRNGNVILREFLAGTPAGASMTIIGPSLSNFDGGAGRFTQDQKIYWASGAFWLGTLDTALGRDGAAQTLAMRTPNSAQISNTAAAFRVYNTSTSSNANYERGVLDWITTGNVFTVGTQQLGTGSARAMSLVVGGTESLNLTTSNTVKFSSANSFTANGANASTTGNIYITGHTAIIKWLTLVDNSGTTIYVPVY
jgi:hypothetical protein